MNIGESGTGKSALGRVVQYSLSCSKFDKSTGDACEKCIYCKQILSLPWIDHKIESGQGFIKDLRKSIVLNRNMKTLFGNPIIHFLDEIQLLNKQSQKRLLKTLDILGPNTFIIATTNEPEKLSTPFRSRFLEVELPLPQKNDFLKLAEKILKNENVQIDSSELNKIFIESACNYRRMLHKLEVAVNSALARKGGE